MHFTEFHEIRLPRFVAIGKDVLKMFGEVVSRAGFKPCKALLVTGSSSTKKFGEIAYDSLSSAGFSTELLFVEQSTSEEVSKVVEYASKMKAELIAGVGGGKVIDVAKVAAHRLSAPFISAPTSASHDGIASPRASILDERGKASIGVAPPAAIIADISVIAAAPRRLFISGCGDIIGKLTAVRDWRLAHRLRGEYYGGYSAALALLAAKIIQTHAEILRRGGEEEVRMVVEALISCGYAMCIAGSSRPCSGSEHLFSHALDMVASKPALHREQVGVGTIMMMYLHGGDWKRVKEALQALGAPTTAKELGVSDDAVIEALTIAHKIRPDRYTILGDKGLTREAAERLAVNTGVIER